MRTGCVLFTSVIIIVSFHSQITLASSKVVVLRDSVQQMSGPLVRELNASGFHATIVTASPDADLEQVAKHENASAAIRLNLKGKQVEVWVADRVTGKIVARTITLEPGGEPEDSIVVLAAVELLRASLMEIYAVHKPKGEVKIDEQTKAFARPAPIPTKSKTRRVSIHLLLGVGGAYVGTETGLSGNGNTALILEFSERFQFSAIGQFTFSPHRLTEPEGTINIYPFVWGAETTALFRKTSHRFRPFVGMGLGAVIFLTRAHASGSYTNPNPDDNREIVTSNPLAIVPVPFIKGGFRLQATDLLFIRFDINLGVGTEKTRIEVADRAVAHVGSIWMSANLGVEMTLW